MQKEYVIQFNQTINKLLCNLSFAGQCIFGKCLIKRNWAIFVHFLTLTSIIFRIFIYVLEDNIASVLLFQGKER